MHDEAISTPKKTKGPSYFRILNKSKEVNKILGTSPKTHTSVLKHVMNRTLKSPRKAKLINSFTNYITPQKVNHVNVTPQFVKHGSVTRELRQIAVLRSKKKNDEASERAQDLINRYGTVKRIANEAVFSEPSVYRLLSMSKKKRVKSVYKRKLSEEMKSDVVRIYQDDKVSYCLPDVKYSGLHFMSITIEEAYKIYLKKCTTERKAASKTFAALKPRWIRTMQQTPMRGSRCDYCTNIGLLHSTIVGLGIKGIPLNHSASIEKTWCAFRSTCHDEDSVRNKKITRDELPQRKCVERKCHDCSVVKYQSDVMTLNSELMKKLNRVSWEQWGKIKQKLPNGKSISKPALLPFEGSASKLLSEYFKQLNKISLHQFLKVWQLRNYNFVIKHLQPGQVLIVQDFQQNLLLYTQDEPKGKHWDHQQVTVHPTIYRCKGGGCPEVVKEDLIHISPDNSHDKYAVFQFFNTTLEHLQKKNVEIKELIIFTDNCTNQYKSKFTFYFLSTLDIPTTHHFYCSHHGKGPSDQAGGNFKRFIKRAIKGNVRLLSTLAIEEYCKDHYDYQATCDGTSDKDGVPKYNKNAKRNSCVTNVHSLFKCIRHAKIVRHADNDNLKTLKGRQKEVQVIRNTGKHGVVEYRLFDCCCFGCVTHSGPCSQPEYGDPWSIASLTNHKKKDLLKFRHDFFPAIFDGRNMTNKVILEVSSDESENFSDYEGNLSDVEPLQDDDNVKRISDTSSDESSEDISDVEPLPEENINENGDSDASSDVQVIGVEEYHSSDCELDDFCNVISYKIPYTADNISPCDESISFDWKGTLKKLGTYRSFSGMANYISSICLPPVVQRMKYCIVDGDKIDEKAEKFWPRDGPGGYKAVETTGYGNCFYHAIS